MSVNITEASVKVMRSYDYNHFEVRLSATGIETTDEVDELRKQAARLADRAVAQYKIMKTKSTAYMDVGLQQKAQAIMENYPMSEWTPEQKAIVKRAEDNAYWAQNDYNYQDDWEMDCA